MNKTKRKKHTHFRYIIIIAIICIASIIAISYAKYTQKAKSNNAYTTENFYFESDLLKENEGAEYNFGDGENSININLKNNADELRYTNQDISYKVLLADSSENTVATKEGTITGGDVNSSAVTFDNLTSGTYTVVAKALTPYTKTLTGKFKINSTNDDINYSVKDTSGSTNLNVTLITNSYSGNVTITFPDGLLPNNIETNFASITSTSATLNVNANSEYSIQFFKTDTSQNYTESNIKVTKSN